MAFRPRDATLQCSNGLLQPIIHSKLIHSAKFFVCFYQNYFLNCKVVCMLVTKGNLSLPFKIHHNGVSSRRCSFIVQQQTAAAYDPQQTDPQCSVPLYFELSDNISSPFKIHLNGVLSKKCKLLQLMIHSVPLYFKL